MKDVCIVVVAMLMIAFPCRYVWQIRRRQIRPTLSTWLIFQAGTLLSLITYAIAERHDFRSGILNTMDTLAVFIIIVAILVWGNRTMRLKKFEGWYLGGVGLIVAYGLITGDAWGSNLFAQGLICIGYFPTFHNLLATKRNTESFAAWSFSLTAGLVGLYPATVDGNTLAAVYAGRTVVLVSITMMLMTYYHFRSPYRMSAS